MFSFRILQMEEFVQVDISVKALYYAKLATQDQQQWFVKDLEKVNIAVSIQIAMQLFIASNSQLGPTLVNVSLGQLLELYVQTTTVASLTSSVGMSVKLMLQQTSKDVQSDMTSLITICLDGEFLSTLLRLIKSTMDNTVFQDQLTTHQGKLQNAYQF